VLGEATNPPRYRGRSGTHPVSIARPDALIAITVFVYRPQFAKSCFADRTASIPAPQRPVFPRKPRLWDDRIRRRPSRQPATLDEEGMAPILSCRDRSARSPSPKPSVRRGPSGRPLSRSRRSTSLSGCHARTSGRWLLLTRGAIVYPRAGVWRGSTRTAIKVTVTATGGLPITTIGS